MFDFNDLLLPFTLPFMQYAMLIAVLVAIPAALLSCFLVLKGWSLVGDGTAHAVLPGVVLSYIVGIPFAIGAFLAGMFFAVSTGFVRENSRIKQDTVMGVVYSGMFGLGIVMYTKIRSGVHLDHILFGDVLGISGQDLIESSLISGLVILVIAAKWRDLLLHSFDIVQARAVGLNVRLLHYGLLVLISLTIVSALKAVGLILSIAIMITPGATAYLLT